MRALLAALCLAASSVSGGSATAQTAALQQFTAWTLYGGRSGDGTPVCGIQSADRAPNGEERQIHIKWFSPNPHFTVQVFKPSWAIPARTRVPFEYRIDGGSRFYGSGIGNGRAVEWTISFNTFDDWLRQFQGGTALRLVFGGDEPPMNISLMGSSAAMVGLANCMRAQNAVRNNSGSTRPY